MIGALAASQMAPKSDKGKIIMTLIIVVVIGVILFFVFKGVKGLFGGLGDFFGFTRDEDEEKLDKTVDERTEQAQSAGSAWSPQYYKDAQAKGIAHTLVSASTADALAKQIWDSVGVFYDTPTQATAAIKQLPTKAAVSWLADRFQQKYDRDLWNWLVFKFDEDDQKKELTNMAHFVDSLPNYKR